MHCFFVKKRTIASLDQSLLKAQSCDVMAILRHITALLFYLSAVTADIHVHVSDTSTLET